MSVVYDEQYVRRYRQHIPFYKSNWPQTDNREKWHHKRSLCDQDCVFGIPVVHDQFLMFVLEDPDFVGDPLVFSGVGQNSRIELCCLDQVDATPQGDDCDDLDWIDVEHITFSNMRTCIIDGNTIQFNYIRLSFQTQICGLRYLKVIAYEGTNQERFFYSEPIHIMSQTEAVDWELVKLNINDKCNIGGIKWDDIYEGWGNDDYIDGYEVYLPKDVKAAFIEEVTDEEVEEDGLGNEVQVFEKVSLKYQFDTGFVPDHYLEIIKELTHTDNNSITIRDIDGAHYFKIHNSETTVTPDGDGCHMNVNVKFTMQEYTSGVCCINQDCQCPQDDAIQAISYTTDQVDAENGVSVGDTYIVPNNGSAGPNPDWKTKDNQIATWNGTGWDYQQNYVELYAYVQDVDDYYLSLGVNNLWVAFDAYITNLVQVGGGTCTVEITGVLPTLIHAKAQIADWGVSNWSDLNGVYYDTNQWQGGITFSVPTAGKYDFRLVPLNVGCSLGISNIRTVTTTENCV